MSFLKSIQTDRVCLLSDAGDFIGARAVQKSAARRSNGVASGQLSWISSRQRLMLESENLKVVVAIFSDGGLALDLAA